MVKQDILNGLKLALEKGETLENAMMSFYLAGYDKKDIEMAAAEVNNMHITPAKPITKTQLATDNKKEKKKRFGFFRKKETKKIDNKLPKKTQVKPTPQKVSSYGNVEKKKSLKKKRLLILIVLISIVLISLGILSLVFLGGLPF